MMRGFVSETRSRAKLLLCRLGRRDLASSVASARQLRREAGRRTLGGRRLLDASLLERRREHGARSSRSRSAPDTPARTPLIQTLTPVASCSDRSTGGRWQRIIAPATTSCSTPSDATVAAARFATPASPRRNTPLARPMKCSTTRNASTRCVSWTCTEAGSTSAFASAERESLTRHRGARILRRQPAHHDGEERHRRAGERTAHRLARHATEPRRVAAESTGADQRRHRRRDEAHRDRPVRERRERRVAELHRDARRAAPPRSRARRRAPPMRSTPPRPPTPGSSRRRHATTSVAMSARRRIDAR